MIIGKFQSKAKGAYAGTIDALPFRHTLTFVPNGAKGPDFILTTEAGCEAGAAWKRTSKDGTKSFVSVKLDSPFLPASVHCALFEQKDGSFALVWEREERKPD